MRVGIIGAGKTGRTLGRLARSAGHEIGPVVCRSQARAEEAVDFIGAGHALTVPEGATLTLVTVPDGAIGEVSRKIPPSPDVVVAHTCASHGAEILRPHRPAGALHPLRSFGDPGRAVELFPGTACAVDGDEAAIAMLSDFTRSIGGVPLRVQSDRKPLYHAGAVFASNYLVALLEAALRLFEKAGIPRGEAAEALGRLARGTADNIASVGVPAALTGPIERGDAETIRRHAEALAEHAPELAGLYADLGRLTVEVAKAKGTIDDGGAGRVTAALGPGKGRS